jgi:hypothetical protein
MARMFIITYKPKVDNQETQKISRKKRRHDVASTAPTDGGKPSSEALAISDFSQQLPIFSEYICSIFALNIIP